MVDLSSSLDEEYLVLDTSWNEEFTKQLSGDLNCGLLGSPSDGKVIIPSDSDRGEEEVHVEDVADVDATPSSIVKSPTSTASTADVATKGVPDDGHDDRTPIRHKAIAVVVEKKSGHLRLPRQEGVCRRHTLKRLVMALHWYTTNSFVKKLWDCDVESLLTLTIFMPLQFLLFLLCPCSVLQTPCRNIIGVHFNSN
jgi:hypothetical protein